MESFFYWFNLIRKQHGSILSENRSSLCVSSAHAGKVSDDSKALYAYMNHDPMLDGREMGDEMEYLSII